MRLGAFVYCDGRASLKRFGEQIGIGCGQRSLSICLAVLNTLRWILIASTVVNAACRAIIKPTDARCVISIVGSVESEPRVVARRRVDRNAPS
jgi:hypothetical protein